MWGPLGSDISTISSSFRFFFSPTKKSKNPNISLIQMGLFSWWRRGGGGPPEPAKGAGGAGVAEVAAAGGTQGAVEVLRRQRQADATVFEFGSAAESGAAVTLAGYCPVSDDLEPCRWELVPAAGEGAPQFRIVF